MKAAIYSRFSTDRQTKSSITDQVRVCSEYAARGGMAIVAQYKDEGISGAAFGNRPAFMKMRAAALAGEFDVLLVSDTSRLSRSQELAPLINLLRFQGVRVIGVQDNFDSSAGTADMQAGLSGIMSVEFRKMIGVKTHTALESRAIAGRSAGGRCYGYTSEAVNPDRPDSQRQYVTDVDQADIVRQIFERYVEGASCRGIAKELNERGIPSPGSSWKRTKRRCNGWVASAVRGIVRNVRYTGLIRWNTSEWRKHPDTGIRKRFDRPESDWKQYQDNSLPIISKSLFEKAQQRTRDTSDSNGRLKNGGRAKYLLSGLLRCGTCGAHYILNSATSYACSGYLGGHCSNAERVRRDRVEQVILDPIRNELLAPECVERMAAEMRKLSAERMREIADRADAVPAEVRAISDRIGRLHKRLSGGDPDLEPDELQVAINRAEEKRQELVDQQPAAKHSAKMISMLPRAAKEYRRQITLGLDKDPRAAGKARAILRKLLGQIDLRPGPDKSLWAEYEVCPAALLNLGTAGASTDGSGGRICLNPDIVERVRIK